MELEAQVRLDGLLQEERPVVVLYSGGRDSTCLLDLAVRVVGAEGVLAVHVNYGLREGAQEDERHCQSMCERLGVALEIRRPRRARRRRRETFRRGHGAKRYDAACELAAARGADVAAGHTATDQAETILYRLASSPSRRALLGMRDRDCELVRPLVLIRPLLRFTRASTRAYCEARGLGWREDESNATGAYARGRVRHELVPALERIHPACAGQRGRAGRDPARGGAVLDELVDSALAGRSEIELSTLRELPPALGRLVVQRLADAAAGGPAAGVARRAPEIVALSDRGTAMLDLPGGVRATVRAGVLTFAPTPPVRRSASERVAGVPTARGNKRAERASYNPLT